MKPGVALAACLGGCVVGCGIAAALGVTTDPRTMRDVDHELAYRLFPVLGVMLAMAVVAYVLNSRVFFWSSLVAAMASLLVPKPNPGHVRYSDLVGGTMASLHEAFLHSATVASTCAITAGMIASLVLSKLVPAFRNRQSRSGETRTGNRDRVDCQEPNGLPLGS